MAIKSIFHINVNCSDHARSRAFYELLGFRSVFEIPEGTDPGMCRGLGLPEGTRARASIMMLDPDDQRSCRLDLIEWTDPATDGKPYSSLTHAGAARIALFTTDLEAEYVRLRAEGVEFISEPVRMGTAADFVCFRDPDGTVLELIEPLRPEAR